MKLKLTCVAFSALFLGSCAKDSLVEVLPKSESVSLRLSATSAGTVTITKADPALPTGVSTGIYVTAKDVTPLSYLYSNQNFVAGDAGALSPASGVSPVSLTVDSSYDVYAYAPFISDIANADAIPVKHGDDVLWVPKSSISGVTKDNCTVPLAFQHRGAQISFKVGFASDFTAGTKLITAASKIEVSGFYATGSLNLRDGSLIPLTSGVTLSAIGTGTPGFMTLGIPVTNFLPTMITMPLSVKVTHEGKTYTGSISTIFGAGTSNEYTITISGRSPDLGVNGTLAPWAIVKSDLNVTESN